MSGKQPRCAQLGDQSGQVGFCRLSCRGERQALRLDLLFRRVSRDEDARGSFGFAFDAFNNHAVCKGAKVHCDLLNSN